MRQIEIIIEAALIALLLSVVPGCAFYYPRTEIGFWDQCIKVDGWGLSYVSPYGPVNLGKLTYERNVNCPKDIKQQVPMSPVVWLQKDDNGGQPATFEAIDWTR